MSPLWWYLNRLAAGLVLDALTCVIAALVVTVVTRSYDATFLFAYLALVLGGVLGAIPSIAIMLFTRASGRPWRSVPVVLAGSIAGFIVVSLPIGALLQRTGNPLIGTIVAIVVFPTLGGAIATRFLRHSD